jgi:type I restriction enzyme M protein
MEGVELEQHHRETLRVLGQQGGMLGLIFEEAQSKIQDPAKLRQLVVELIGKEHWSAMSADVKGDAYEGLLERDAQDVKGGAGQYFTPRALIDAIVDCVRPRPGEIVVDPACRDRAERRAPVRDEPLSPRHRTRRRPRPRAADPHRRRPA